MDSNTLYVLIAYIFFLLTAVVLMIVGIIKMKKPDIYDREIMGIVTNSFCVFNGKKRYDCQLDVRYIVNGKEYKTKVSEYNNYFRIDPGKTVRMRYSSKNPDQATNRSSNKVAGMSMVISGCILLCIMIAIPIAIKFYS